jgi:hypothetical protein
VTVEERLKALEERVGELEDARRTGSSEGHSCRCSDMHTILGTTGVADLLDLDEIEPPVPGEAVVSTVGNVKLVQPGGMQYRSKPKRPDGEWGALKR